MKVAEDFIRSFISSSVESILHSLSCDPISQVDNSKVGVITFEKKLSFCAKLIGIELTSSELTNMKRKICSFQPLSKKARIANLKRNLATNSAELNPASLEKTSKTSSMFKVALTIDCLKTYKCNFCDMESKLSSSIRRHIEAKHVQGSRDFECLNCDYVSK